MQRDRSTTVTETEQAPECSEPIITVAICTYRRYDLLPRALEALERQTIDPRTFEVLVVDNTDDVELRQSFAATLAGRQGVSVMFSDPPGLSRARNLALERCRTRYIAFIDDDAVPDSGWLDALVAGFQVSGAAVVAGPIDPEWPVARPDWVPDKYIACLTVLDYGPQSRALGEFEFAYGTNMAFETQMLRSAGGFDASLGRTGAKTLVSDEEIQIQLELRRRGARTWYASDARVRHLVHANRVRRNYFRSRMAWQAVSTLLHDSPLWWADQSREELLRAAATLGLEDAVARLLCSGGSETFSAQIDFIYHLFLLVLHANMEPDDVIDQLASTAATTLPPSDREHDTAGLTTGIGRLAMPIAAGTRHLFLDATSSHAFLYDAYGDLPGSQLLRLPGNLWDARDRDLDELRILAGRGLQSLVFLSLEAFVYGPSWPRFRRLLAEVPVPVFGILHRFPWDRQHAENLREVAKRVRVMVLAEAMADRLAREHGLHEIRYLPLHPTHAAYLGRDAAPIRNRAGAGQGQIVFSALGEARKGKGIELFLDALDHVPNERRKEVFVLLGGRAKDVTREEVCARLSRSGYDAHVALRSSEDPLNYAVLSERELGEFMNITDVGMLLYQEDQRNCMSGVLPNYAWGAKPVIATSNSIVGRLTSQYNLGRVIEHETPDEVAAAMVCVIDEIKEGTARRYRNDAFRRSVERSAVIERLADILADPLPPRTA